ncbi:Uncharacterised protein at_DN0309 [Pycnogonum litorale]
MKYLSSVPQKIAAILFVLLASSLISVPCHVYWGKCPSLPVLKNFNFKKFQGTWYVMDIIFPMFSQPRRECITYTFKETIEGGMAAIERGTFDGYIRAPDSVGLVRTVNPFYHNVFELRHRVGMKKAGTSGMYYVLDTDYRHFALLWMCSDYNVFRNERLWILSRRKFPGHRFFYEIGKLIRFFDLNIKDLYRLDWKKCVD